MANHWVLASAGLGAGVRCPGHPDPTAIDRFAAFLPR